MKHIRLKFLLTSDWFSEGNSWRHTYGNFEAVKKLQSAADLLRLHSKQKRAIVRVQSIVKCLCPTRIRVSSNFPNLAEFRSGTLDDNTCILNMFYLFIYFEYEYLYWRQKWEKTIFCCVSELDWIQSKSFFYKLSFLY